jgi:hypothetical protein
VPESVRGIGEPFWADWGDDEYFAYASVAHARRESGESLSVIDQEVLQRYPDRPSMFDPLPSAVVAEAGYPSLAGRVTMAKRTWGSR